MDEPILIDKNQPESASILNIKSFNARSLGKQPKRRQVFNSLKKKELDIIFLIDTRFSKKIENTVKAEWGGNAYFSSFTSNARGVAILFRKNIPVETKEYGTCVLLWSIDLGQSSLVCILWRIRIAA